MQQLSGALEGRSEELRRVILAILCSTDSPITFNRVLFCEGRVNAEIRWPEACLTAKHHVMRVAAHDENGGSDRTGTLKRALID
jgi:hypothetical protein